MTALQSTRPPRSRLKGRDVVLVLFVAVFATAVVPPLAAWRLNRSRIDEAVTTAEEIVARLRAQRDDLARSADRDDVVCGPGRLPKASLEGQAWLAAPTTNADLFGARRPTDPWGRCFLVNLSGLANGQPVLLISAGPNAFIDTPLGASQPALDDVAVRVW